MTVLPMAHSATRITPAPRPPALAARHAAPSPLVEPTDPMNRAVRSLTPPPRSPARQSAPRRGCACRRPLSAGSTGLFMSERDGLCREATTDSACRTTSTASPEGRYPDTRVPGRWVPRRARCVRPSTVGACSSGLRPDDGRQSPGLCPQHPVEVAPDQDPFLGEVSRAQPYGSRIRHEDEKAVRHLRSAILKTHR